MIRLVLTDDQETGGREWIRTHRNVPVMETPLWVLISLGIIAVREEHDEIRTGKDIS